MLHRHLQSPGYALAAIDDIIERGQLEDWIDLAMRIRDDPTIEQKVRRIVEARSGEQSTIHHEFWRARLARIDAVAAKARDVRT